MALNNSEILLETGTNELEVLEFIIAGNNFGINVAKIRELMQYQPIQPMPRSHEFVEGIFKPRGEVFTIIDLASYLGLPPSEDTERDIFIVAGFSRMNIAFHVHSVESIHRISWNQIEKPNTTIYGGRDGIVTGIAKIKDRIISIVDFEKIVAEISPESSIQLSSISHLSDRPNVEKPILVAEDSEYLRKLLTEALRAAGYNNLIETANGQEAWDRLNSLRGTPATLPERVALVITDIEMPQMDGHHLCKRIKEDPDLRILPVIIFSSLIDEAMEFKGKSVGANAQLSKPQIGELVEIIDQLIL